MLRRCEVRAGRQVMNEWIDELRSVEAGWDDGGEDAGGRISGRVSVTR